jgi:hypothetical protein
MARISAKSAAAQWGLVQIRGRAVKYRVLCRVRRSGSVVLRAEPRTGRTHQIRVHAASAGLPLYGDTLYGGPDRAGGRTVPRVMLHAASLALPHPSGGRLLTILAPVPGDPGPATQSFGLSQGACQTYPALRIFLPGICLCLAGSLVSCRFRSPRCAGVPVSGGGACRVAVAESNACRWVSATEKVPGPVKPINRINH